MGEEDPGKERLCKEEAGTDAEAVFWATAVREATGVGAADVREEEVEDATDDGEAMEVEWEVVEVAAAIRDAMEEGEAREAVGENEEAREVLWEVVEGTGAVRGVADDGEARPGVREVAEGTVSVREAVKAETREATDPGAEEEEEEVAAVVGVATAAVAGVTGAEED